MKEGLFCLLLVSMLFVFIGVLSYQDTLTVHKRLDLINQAIKSGSPPLVARCTYQ